ncbi:MAG: hypothetical protein KDN22_07265, partial [Verrucomicrobiae bacterium]|nr:hypothetical protein [Verrucomicrobiae bacterium]
GSISMTGGNSRILGTGVLINRDHVISGIGNIGFNQAAVTNSAQGTIHADIAGGTLFIDPNAVLGFVNDGALRASGGGTLDLSGFGGGQFTFGESSVVEALDGGSITHRNGALLTNLKDGTLTDGTYRVIDDGNGASLALPGGSITTNAASIELAGSGAAFAQLSSLNLNGGSLSVDKGAELNLSGRFEQAASGSLTVGIGGATANTSLWSRITAAGAAVLDGALDVMFNIGNTFTAAIGNTWKFLTTPLRTGEFSNVTFTAEGLPANSKLAVNYLEDGVEVEVVPESAQLVTGVTYASWAAALPKGIDADPAADDDGDGASNLQEYAFAMDPLSSDAELLPQPELVRMNGQTFAAIRYARLAGNAGPSDIAYVVEQSADLENWMPADVESDSSIDELNEIETLKARCLNSLASSSGQCSYLRVSLERQ